MFWIPQTKNRWLRRVYAPLDGTRLRASFAQAWYLMKQPKFTGIMPRSFIGRRNYC